MGCCERDFRTLKRWLMEQGLKWGFDSPKDKKSGNAVKQAYRRGDALKLRRVLRMTISSVILITLLRFFAYLIHAFTYPVTSIG